jgi:hypothetical protein
MILRAFAFTMPALGFQGTILPNRIGSAARFADQGLDAVAAGVRVWNTVSALGYGESGQSYAKGASLG